MFRTPISLFAMLSLSGCVAIVPIAAPVPVQASSAVCRNDGLDQFRGQPATQALGAQMLRVSGAKTMQWIPLGTMVTMDFRAERLRVRLDASGKVERAGCG